MADTYDPDASEEDVKHRSKYATPKDILMIIGIIAVIVWILRPVYLHYVDESKQTRCASNMNNIYKAMQLYALDQNDRYPPAFYADVNGNPVLVGDQHLPLTWASIVQPLMKTSEDFFCPKAEPKENSYSLPFTGTLPIKLSYGLYAAMSLRSQTDISSPGSTILFAETSNRGSLSTYDPLPIGGKSNPMAYDGFLIAYDNSNFADVNSIRDAKFITRLAFPKTSGKTFELNGPTRHRVGIHGIFADGSLADMKPDSAEVTRKSAYDDNIDGLWSTR